MVAEAEKVEILGADWDGELLVCPQVPVTQQGNRTGLISPATRIGDGLPGGNFLKGMATSAGNVRGLGLKLLFPPVLMISSSAD